MVDLSKRFATFIRTLRGFEDVDGLLKNVHLDGKKRADYLLWDRQIIIEQKDLLIDPSDKPQKFVNRLMEQGKVLGYGTASTKRVFSGMDDGDSQQAKLFRSITKGLEDSFADADKQTRDTREIFAIPDAVGIVVFLNVSAPTLRPDLISYGLSQASNKLMVDGSKRYVNNDGIIVLSEAHTDVTYQGSRGAPCFSFATPASRSVRVVNQFSEWLVSEWSAFNGLPMVRQDRFHF